jgi:predicted lipid carrier protein YhbT
VVAFLDHAWLDLRLTLGRDLPEQPGVSARVQHVVTGGPDGEVRYHERIVEGRVVGAALGVDPEAEVTLTQTYADARLVAEGELDASVAFMQGRVKIVGDMGTVMALMPLTQSDAHRALLAEVSRQTDC